jgi:hypothetical protein
MQAGTHREALTVPQKRHEMIATEKHCLDTLSASCQNQEDEREMDREEQRLDYASGADTGNSAISFSEIVDHLAWKDTFPSKVDPLPGEKSSNFEIPNLHTANSAAGAQHDKAGSDTATADSPSDGGKKQEAGTKPPDGAAIKKMVEDLGSDNFATRQKATAQLEAAGVAALPYLKDAVRSDDKETRRRAQGIVDSALSKYAEPQTLDKWLNEDRNPPDAIPNMLKKEWTPEQAKERSEALKALAQFKRDTGYGSFEIASLETQADEWSDMKGCLARITELRLPGPHVTDESIGNIKNLPNLKHLDLANSRVTDKSLENLKDLGRLRSVDLTDTAITDKGLGHLKDCKNLEALILQNTKITDEGTAALKGLKFLEELSLAGTKVTDKCIGNLKDLPLLNTMDVKDSGITDEGMKKLPRVRPASKGY